jgi:branched-subunit amino acid aminotransferase/4-amino-4-deoxychorismate lyase
MHSLARISAVAWTVNGVLHTPCWRTLGMLQSTTLTLMVEAAKNAGIPVNEGAHILDAIRLYDPDNFNFIPIKGWP